MSCFLLQLFQQGLKVNINTSYDGTRVIIMVISVIGLGNTAANLSHVVQRLVESNTEHWTAAVLKLTRGCW